MGYYLTPLYFAVGALLSCYSTKIAPENWQYRMMNPIQRSAVLFFVIVVTLTVWPVLIAFSVYKALGGEHEK